MMATGCDPLDQVLQRATAYGTPDRTCQDADGPYRGQARHVDVNDDPTDWRTLTEELEELEQSDPEVAAATASYDRMVERITSRRLPEREIPQHHCKWCGSTQINYWKSWNVTGEWTCDDCTPDDDTCA